MIAGGASRAPSGEMLAWAGVATVAGALVGAGATVSVTLAAGLAVAVAFGVGLVRSRAFLLSVMVASVFLDAVDVVPLSRLLAPVALVALVVTARRPAVAAAPFGWAAAYTVWALASFIWTVSAGSTGFQVVSLAIALVYMLTFATLVISERDVLRCLQAFVLTAVAVGALGIVAYALQIASLTQAGRAFGAAGDPNFFALYQVMAIPLALALLAETRDRQRRRQLHAGIAVLVISVFASVSRGGLLSLGVVVALTLLTPARSLLGSGRQKLAFLAVLLGAVLLAVVVAGGAVGARVGSLHSADETGSGRTALWSAAHTSIRERPMLGLGYGAFPAAVDDLMRRTPGIDFRHIELHPGRGSEAHDVYISSLAELGLLGLALLLGLLVATARELWRTAAAARRAGADALARAADALLVALAGWAVASLFLTTETSRALWIAIGLGAALSRLVRSQALA